MILLRSLVLCAYSLSLPCDAPTHLFCVCFPSYGVHALSHALSLSCFARPLPLLCAMLCAYSLFLAMHPLSWFALALPLAVRTLSLVRCALSCLALDSVRLSRLSRPSVCLSAYWFVYLSIGLIFLPVLYQSDRSVFLPMSPVALATYI